ncbi:MAG: circularly permuted type 2 ATP-grasp protein [Acidobacteria bacterium]|nr:circularly permuted type 2 ATP-grasp protein [Acidobacteriota bacterium]
MPDPIAEYHRLLEADAPAADEQARWLREAFARESVTFDGEPMPSFVRPHFVPRGDWDALRSQGVRVMEVAARVAREVFDGDVGRLCAFLGTPESEARWVSVDPGPPDVVLSRLDAFVTPEGPRFIEINSDAPAGFGYSDRMARLFQELPVFRDFARGLPVSYQRSDAALVRAVVGQWRPSGDAARPRIAIVDWAEVKTRPDQEILREAFAARGFECLLADPREVDIREGRLHAGGAAVDLVYRRAVLSELVEGEDDVKAFLQAYRQRLCPFVNSFRCRLSEDKAFFAVLTDEAFAHLMSEEEIGLLSRVLPWTRRVAERRTLKRGREIDLLPYVIENREHLVLKPAHSYGGRSVYLGSETSPEDWESAARAGLEAPWVVQERVTIPEEPFPVLDHETGEMTFVPLKVNANPFYVAGEEAGAVTRASRSSVINVSAGGGSVPTFVVG